MRPGSIRGKRGRFSIWRVPNFLLEPRGAYLGERDSVIDRLSKARSVTGAIIVLGMIVSFHGLSHLTRRHGQQVDLVSNTPEGSWLQGIQIAADFTVILIPLATLGVIAWTRRGARWAAFRQLRWPFLSIIGTLALFTAFSPIIGGLTYLERKTTHAGAAEVLGVGALIFVVGIIIMVWIIKSLYLVGAGLFRAEDGHPFLAPVTSVAVVWFTAIYMYSLGNGLSGVPKYLELPTGFGGAVTITILSVITMARLRRKYSAWPFRDGPVIAASRG